MKTVSVAVGQMYVNPRELVDHEHPPSHEDVAVVQAKSTLKRRATEELVTVPTLYRQVHNDLLQESEGAAAVFPTFR